MNRGMTKGMSCRLPAITFVLTVILISLAASCNAQAWKCFAFWVKSPFKQLNCFLTKSTSSNELGENLRVVQEFLEQQQLTGQKNKKKLMDAAIQFASLSIFRGQPGDRCNADGTEVLTKLQEAMVADFGDELKSNNIRLYRVVQLHQETMKRHFKACWQQYTNKWKQFKPDQELGPTAAKVLDTLAEGLRETHCQTPRYNGFELSIKAYLCAKQRSRESLTKSVWPIVKSLEEFVELRDEAGDEEANQQPAGDQTDTKSKLYLLASEGRGPIEKLLKEAFYEPCQNLVETNEMARQTIARVPQLTGLLPTLERLDQGESTDQLLEWAYRQQICERLLKRTKLAQLTDEVMKWIEDRSEGLKKVTWATPEAEYLV